MKLRTAANLLTATVIAATAVVGTSASANAASWNCDTHISPDRYSAMVTCDGNGPVRVAAWCDLDRYPYRTKIYGNWATTTSIVDQRSCFISSAWPEVG
ncbi:hypothetical protein [Streptomyces sp. NPDC047974]|uniref:hypothetical protein n=1 Tax=Streptomyces sp. NPDC047974 TaxID=3154343 RepID=UPI0033EC9F6A